MSEPTRWEQMGALMTAMIAVIVSGQSEVRISKAPRHYAPVLEDTPDNRYACQRVAWNLHLSYQYVHQIALGKRYSKRVVDSLQRARRKLDRYELAKKLWAERDAKTAELASKAGGAK